MIPFQEGNQPSQPLQPKKWEENDCPSLEKRDVVDPEICSNEDQSSKKIPKFVQKNVRKNVIPQKKFPLFIPKIVQVRK